MKTLHIAIIALLSVGVGFLLGTNYQKNQTPKNSIFPGRQLNGQNFQGNQNRFRGGFRPINGEVTSIDDKSMTVKMLDGSSKIVVLSDNSTFDKSVAANKADVKVGEKIAVMGVENSDGSITAQTVQINPTLRMITGTPQGQK